jgi:hypothetical protein
VRPIFRTFFPGKSLSTENSVEFVGKTFFSKPFPCKITFFPTFFGGKFSAEFSPKFSLEKMYEKSAPGPKPTTSIYNASLVKINSATNSMARF